MSAWDGPSISETGESANASALVSLTKLWKILPWRPRPASRVLWLIVSILDAALPGTDDRRGISPRSRTARSRPRSQGCGTAGPGGKQSRLRVPGPDGVPVRRGPAFGVAGSRPGVGFLDHPGGSIQDRARAQGAASSASGPEAHCPAHSGFCADAATPSFGVILISLPSAYQRRVSTCPQHRWVPWRDRGQSWRSPQARSCVMIAWSALFWRSFRVLSGNRRSLVLCSPSTPMPSTGSEPSHRTYGSWSSCWAIRSVVPVTEQRSVLGWSWTAHRTVPAIFRIASDSADCRRHASTMVRCGAGRVIGRVTSSDRRVSVATEMSGSKVIPMLAYAICTRVGRLVARKLSSSIPLPLQNSIT